MPRYPKSIISLFLISFILFSCDCNKEKNTSIAKAELATNQNKKPKNIILLIGDGMGLSQVSIAQYYQDTPSNFERFPIIGLIKNSSATHVITDSAAGATAFSCGIKTGNRTIGVDKELNSVETILETVSKKGLATGLVVTSPITGATPASFYAHAKSRYEYEEIASYLPQSDVDFFAGGGLQFFNNRKDGKNIFTELDQHGFKVDTLSLPKEISEKKHAIILAKNEMPRINERGNYLIDASKLAINKLSKNEKGYFLMIEGSLIDWECHDQEVENLIDEQLDFDKTIGQILDYAIQNKETLVIVTADHETGAFALAMEDNDYGKIKPTLYSDDHTATMVPVFAYGPGSELFSGVYENTAIYHKMLSLFKRD